MNATEIGSPAFPVLHVRELAKGVDFYQKLGFILETEYEGQVTLSRNQNKLHLRLDGEGTADAGGAYFSVDCADAFLQELHALEIAVRERCSERPWRMREFSICDPDGNLLRFGEKFQDGVYS